MSIPRLLVEAVSMVMDAKGAIDCAHEITRWMGGLPCRWIFGNSRGSSHRCKGLVPETYTLCSFRLDLILLDMTWMTILRHYFVLIGRGILDYFRHLLAIAGIHLGLALIVCLGLIIVFIAKDFAADGQPLSYYLSFPVMLFGYWLMLWPFARMFGSWLNLAAFAACSIVVVSAFWFAHGFLF